MDNNESKNEYGKELISWEVPEYEKHERSRNWYIKAGIIGALFMIYSFFTANFLFAVIILIVVLVAIMHEGRSPELIKITLTEEGIIVGNKFYDFDEIKDFFMIYKPRVGTKNLYFEFKNSMKQRLSINLIDQNPIPIRESLLKFLPENKERTEQPLSEGLAKMFKI